MPTDVVSTKSVAVIFVPKLLNFGQKNRRMSMAQEPLNDVNDDPDLLEKLITDGETWVHGYAMATKAQSIQWKRPDV